MSLLFTFALGAAQSLAHSRCSMKYWFKLNVGLFPKRERERELICGAVLVNANIACPNRFMFPWKHNR